VSFFARCILSRIEGKIFCLVVLDVLGQDLNHLAHKENTQSEFFLLGRLKILIAFCSLMALIYM
jgi:hypothetical protein